MPTIKEIKEIFPSYNGVLKKKYTFKNSEKIKKGLIFREKFSTFDFEVNTGPFSLCAYLKLNKDFWPREFLLYFPSYLNVHGGVTFENEKPVNKIKIYGWDYAHYSDQSFGVTKGFIGFNGGFKEWGLHEVLYNNIKVINNVFKYEKIILNSKKEIILNLKSDDFLTKKLIKIVLKKK